MTRYDPEVEEYGRHAIKMKFSKQCRYQGLVVRQLKFKDGLHFARCRPQLILNWKIAWPDKMETHPTGFFVRDAIR